MKKLLLICLSSLAVFSTAAAQVQYAQLANFKGNTIQADFIDLVTPQVAVSRQTIPASDAVHYKAVFSNQNTQLRDFALSPKATVTLLTFPSLAPKNTTLENLRLLLENSDLLPSEFEISSIFALKITGTTITSLTQVNTRAVTGVFEQGVLISKKTIFNPLTLRLDFIYMYSSQREMKRDGQTMDNNPGGLYISNNNPALRSFAFAQSGRIRLLKNASEYIIVTPQQLEAGLNGRDFGWLFSWETYFYATISDKTGQVLELRQGYIP